MTSEASERAGRWEGRGRWLGVSGRGPEARDGREGGGAHPFELVERCLVSTLLEEDECPFERGRPWFGGSSHLVFGTEGERLENEVVEG